MNNIDAYLKTLERELRILPSQRRREIIEQIKGDYFAQEDNNNTFRLPDPVQLAKEFTQDIKPEPAKLSTRLAAALVDTALLFLLFSLIILVPFYYIGNVALSGLYALFAVLFTLTGVFLYFPITEGYFGQTLGKWLMGLLVIQEDGRSCSYGTAFLRRIPLWFGFFWFDALTALFLPQNQRAFDRVARTLVVKTRQPKVAPLFLLAILLCCALVTVPFISNVRDFSVTTHIRQWFDDSVPYTPGSEISIIGLGDSTLWDFIGDFDLSLGQIDLKEASNSQIMTIPLKGKNFTINFTAYKGNDAHQYITQWNNKDNMRMMSVTNNSRIHNVFYTKYRTKLYYKQGWQRGEWAFFIEVPKDRMSVKDFNDLVKWIALKLKTLN